MNWTKLPPIEGSTACVTCGCGAHEVLHPHKLLAVGFGGVTVSKDGEQIYSEPQVDEDNFWECKDAETIAKHDPDHDYRIHFYAPLYEAEYQRQGDNHWVLIRKGEGFA